MADKVEEAEVERLLTVLRTMLRLLGLNNREIERRLGLTPSYLGRLFGGTIELKVEHVLAITRAMGLKPAEFFELAYPRVSEPSEAASKIRRMLEDLHPPESRTRLIPGIEITDDELQQKIQESVRQALRDLAGSR